jgi:hypothetical protein
MSLDGVFAEITEELIELAPGEISGAFTAALNSQ